MGTKREHADSNVIRGPWSAPTHTGADGRARDELAKQIAAQLVDGQGSVVRWTVDLADLDGWRRAARAAGRLLGVSVRTGVSDDGTKVWVVDDES